MGLGYGGLVAYGEGSYKGYLIGEITVPYNKINHSTGLCLRLGLTDDQGAGWCQYENGEYWVWPEEFAEVLEVIDENGHQRWLVPDELSGEYWEIGTRDGPAGSGMYATYLDKLADYGGAEIPCTVQLPELTASQESQEVEHAEAHLYLRPQEPENKGDSAYNSEGYRKAFYLDYYAFINGVQSEKTRTKETPYNGDLHFDRDTRCNRFLPAFYTATSEFKLASVDIYLITRDKSGTRAKVTTKEMDWMREYENQCLWISRGPQPLLNRANNVLCTGSYYSLVSSPDGGTDAMLFTVGQDMSTPITSLDGNFTLQFWVNNYDIPAVLFNSSIGGLSIGLVRDMVTNEIYVTFNDGTNIIAQNLGWNGASWAFIKISRKGTDLLINHNGVLLNTFALYSLITYGGIFSRDNTFAGELYDIRILPSATSDAAFLYFYNDMIYNSGKATLWPY